MKEIYRFRSGRGCQSFQSAPCMYALYCVKKLSHAVFVRHGMDKIYGSGKVRGPTE